MSRADSGPDAKRTRGWSAIVRPGPVPKLIVQGQVSTHPYAQAFLKETHAPSGQQHILCLDLCVLGDSPHADVRDWKTVTIEKRLLDVSYERVTIGGAGTQIYLDVR